MAILYGADAVYLGGERFGLRAASRNFSIDQMLEAVDFTHQHGKRVYVTVNIIPHNEDFQGLEEYLTQLYTIGVDALLISDPGILQIAQSTIPKMEFHLSTQASITNKYSARFWAGQGFSRIVLARELCVQEISEIRDFLTPEVELETFIHGAMCMSYSGRCLISNYLNSRDANRGDCTQPCRWKYVLMEEKRPQQYFPIFEEDQLTYFFNSKDLCMIDHLDALIGAGIRCFKIEGRMKSAYYVAMVTRVYRMALDAYLSNPTEWKADPSWKEELRNASHRGFTTGFYFGKPSEEDQQYDSNVCEPSRTFLGIVLKGTENQGESLIEQRNRFFTGQPFEAVRPYDPEVRRGWIKEIRNQENEIIESASHPQQKVWLKTDIPLFPAEIIRTVETSV